MKDGLGLDLGKTVAVAHAGLNAHFKSKIPYIPTPFALAGRLKVRDGERIFKIRKSRPSPLKARITPETAAHRISCLHNLSSGLGYFCDRLMDLYMRDSVRAIKASDLESFPTKLYDQDRALGDMESDLYRLWEMYVEAYPKINEECRWRDEAEYRFVLVCLKVHLAIYTLTTLRYILACTEMRLETQGRANHVIDTQIELSVWQHQLERKVREFCSGHPWVKLDLSGLLSGDGPRGTSGQFPFADTTTDGALVLYRRLNTRLQCDVGHATQESEQPVGSPLETFEGVSRDYSLSQASHPPSSSPVPKTNTDIVIDLDSGILCQACEGDLYVLPPIDPSKEDEDEPLKTPSEPSDKASSPPPDSPKWTNYVGLEGTTDMENDKSKEIDSDGDSLMSNGGEEYKSKSPRKETDSGSEGNSGSGTDSDGDTDMTKGEDKGSENDTDNELGADPEPELEPELAQVSPPSNTAAEASPASPEIEEPPCCRGDTDWWFEHQFDAFVPPKPIFCSECRVGCHTACFERWNGGKAHLDCSPCRTRRTTQRREQLDRRLREMRRMERAEREDTPPHDSPSGRRNTL